MIYFKMQNYDEFKELFVRENGTRQNGILLSYWKHAFRNNLPIDIKSMTELYNFMMDRFCNYSKLHTFKLLDFYLSSNEYNLDCYKGLCEDNDCKSIRYVRNDGKVFKMKAGRFLRKIIEESQLHLNEQTIIYLCETFAREWEAYAFTQLKEYKLVVDEDFEAIYNGNNYTSGDFGSCMTNDDQYDFYEYSVNASAASIWKNGELYARCVIFNKVYEVGSNRVWRLAERQYSADGNETLKQILVNMLIKEDYIDGYKKVGADCHNSHAFVDNEGNDLSGLDFYIDCNLNGDDTLSYQDSFKYYDMYSGKAYNDSGYEYQFDLATTSSQLELERDSYHDRFCQSVSSVNVWSSYSNCYHQETCDDRDLDDFTYYDGEYYDETAYCSYSDRYIPLDVATYCEYDDCYCHEDYAIWFEPANSYFASENDITDWKARNMEYCDSCEEYVDETIRVFRWNRHYRTYLASLVCHECLEDEGFICYDGEYYDEVNEDGVPFHLAVTEEVPA